VALEVTLMPEPLNERLKAARRRAEITQADLAKVLAVSPRTVGAWERGETRISGEDLVRAEQVLGSLRPPGDDQVQFVSVEPPSGVDSLEVALSIRRELDQVPDPEERLRVLQRLLADERRRRGVPSTDEGPGANG
jgi:transcriptional regulator with XRE-family HTH domain